MAHAFASFLCIATQGHSRIATGLKVAKVTEGMAVVRRYMPSGDTAEENTVFLDVRQLTELQGITTSSDGLFLGAAVRDPCR